MPTCPPTQTAVCQLDASGAVVFTNEGQDDSAGNGDYKEILSSVTLATGGADRWILATVWSNQPTPIEPLENTVPLWMVDGQGYGFGLSPTGAELDAFADGAGDKLLQINVPTGAGMLPSPWNVNTPYGALGKYDPTDTVAWGEPLPQGAVVQVDPVTGSSYVVGGGNFDLGCGMVTTSGMMAGVMDTNGTCVWSRAAGATASFVIGASHDYLVGTFTGSLDLGCGAMTSTSTASYVAEISRTGTCVWSRTVPLTDVNLVELASGQPLIQGASTGTADVGCGAVTGTWALAKLGAAGACAWSRGFTQPVNLSPFSDGDVALSFDYAGTVDFGCGALTSAGTLDLAVARLIGGTGACAWSRSFGAAGVTVTGAGAVSEPGYVVAWGNLAGGSVDFGGGPVTTSGYVMELDGTGAFRFEHPYSATTLVTLDPCGPVLLGSLCATCGVGGALGVTVTKLAP